MAGNMGHGMEHGMDEKRTDDGEVQNSGPAGLPSNRSAVEVTVVDQERSGSSRYPAGLPSNRSAVEVTADQACKLRLNMSPPRNSSPRLRARG